MEDASFILSKGIIARKTPCVDRQGKIIVSLLLFAFTTLLGRTAVAALNDYTAQRRQGKDPVFRASAIGLEQQTDFWN